MTLAGERNIIPRLYSERRWGEVGDDTVFRYIVDGTKGAGFQIIVSGAKETLRAWRSTGTEETEPSRRSSEGCYLRDVAGEVGHDCKGNAKTRDSESDASVSFSFSLSPLCSST